MNNVLVAFAAFAAGAGCGVLACKSYFEKKYKSVADEEILSVIETYRKKTEELEKEEEKEKYAKTIYHKHVDNYISSAPLEIDVDRVAIAEMEHPEDDEPDEQYQITSMDFFDDCEYDKVSLTYYANDDVLVGPSKFKDEDILDVGSTVGEDAIDLISNGFDDGSALYIRNPKTSTDYEISKSYISYKEMMSHE